MKLRRRVASCCFGLVAIKPFSDVGNCVNPSDANAFCGRGSVYAHRGDIDHAISDYDKALRLNPSLANALYDPGNAYVLNGDYDRAIQDYD